MFKLTKIFLQEGKQSDVKVGEQSTSERIKVIRYVELSELKEGDEVFVGTSFLNCIKTSPLQRVSKVSDSLYTLFTRTSTYHLEKV